MLRRILPLLRLPDSLRLRLILFSAAIALPFVGLLWWGIADRLRTDRETAALNLRAQREIAQKSIAAHLERLRLRMEDLERTCDFSRPDDPVTRLECEQFLRFHPEAINVAVVDRQGLLRFSTAFPVADPPQDFSRMEIVRPLLTATAWTVSNGGRGLQTGRWGFIVTTPLRQRPDLLLAVPLDLVEFSRRVILAADERDLIITVGDANNLAILSSYQPEQRIGTLRPAASVVRDRLRQGLTTGEFIGNDGEARTYDAASIAGTSWIITAALPTAVIDHAARASFKISVLLVLGAVVLGVFIVHYSSRSLARPVAALARTARAMAANPAAPLAPVDGPQEIAETARAFNEMVVARRASEERYRIVADETGQLIYEYEIATGTLHVFGEVAARQILGTHPDTLARGGVTAWSKLLHPDERDAAVRRFQQSITLGTPCRAEYRLRHADGSYRVVDESGVVLRDASGALVRMIGRMTDITERRAAEAAQQQLHRKMLETQKLESLGVLAGGIAHDFNNILTGIMGHANLARADAPAGWPGLEHLQQVEKAAHRAADLCRQMLAYSGRGRFVIQAVDLNEIVSDTEQLLAVSVSKKAVLRLSTDPRPLPIRADPTQLRQVIMNLVINASEALEDRTGRISLMTAGVDLDSAALAELHLADDLAPGPYCCLAVNDDGVGMSDETLARIFDPFFTTKFTGRGLGLAAVQGIVRSHRGAIKVESKPGHGTTFRIFLPLTTDPARPLHPPTASAHPWRASGRILVVDDEEPVRQVSALALEQAGFTVDQACDGEEALARFSREPQAYTAVLLDLTMPRLGGRETFRRLRELSPRARVVLMSGFSRHDAIHRFSAEGLAGFIEKPFGLDALLAELRRVIEDRPPAPPPA